MDDIKSYDSFQADRVGENKPTKTNITYSYFKKGDPSKRDKVDKLNKMGHVFYDSLLERGNTKVKLNWLRPYS